MRDRIRHLSKGVAIYGAGDAAVQVVNFFLLPVYVKYSFLTERDYGALALLLFAETFAKVLSRWGLDGAFMRYYHEREGAARVRLASTIAWFLLAANGAAFGLLLAGSHAIGGRLFTADGYVPALQLMFVNTFLLAFTFLPFHAMRLRNEAVTYSGFAFARSVGTLLLRVLFVIGLGMGITGVYLADLAVTVVLVPLLWPWARPLLGAAFSAGDLRTALRFGLPRVPHGLAQQALEGGNKFILSRVIPQRDLGVYQNGVTLGAVVKYFTSAFETAWAPFYYATARQADAREVFSRMTTYGVAVLTLLVAGVTAVSRDVVLVMLTPEYLPAARVIPLVAVAMGFQGAYLLTSIGLNLTSRTEFYPVATFAAAAVGLGGGIPLMLAWGLTGAAVAFLLSYLTQWAVAFALAQRFYAVRYERARLVRVIGAGVIAAAAGRFLLPALPPLAGLAARGAVAAAIFLGLLWMSGFLRPTERAFLGEAWRRLRRGPGSGGDAR